MKKIVDIWRIICYNTLVTINERWCYSMRQRNTITVILLTMVTCGLYLFFWLSKACDDTNKYCSDVAGGPVNKSLIWLSFITCGITMLVLYYKLFVKWDAKASKMNINLPVKGAGLMFLSMFVPFFSYYVLVESINRIEDACNR